MPGGPRPHKPFFQLVRPLGKHKTSLAALMNTKYRIARWNVFLALGLLALAGSKTTCAAGQDAASYELLPTGTSQPHLFAEGVISTPDDEAGGVFSPGGRDFYFVKFNATTTFPRIGLMCVSHWQNGKWTTPEVLPFSGKSLDFPPRLLPGRADHVFLIVARSTWNEGARAAHLESREDERRVGRARTSAPLLSTPRKTIGIGARL